ncbi:hypothetical protein [Entomomonas moraniae]|uniref:hypothetical protein n=1 Tax=Entomomonas moraniae TaxID=2213226 RepID=UPI0013E046C4|nr:hypothetical protein [Entomomonas moraniae]
MRWAKVSDWCIVSEEGYKVAKYGEKFRASNPKGEFITGFVSAEKAKKACEVGSGK